MENIDEDGGGAGTEPARFSVAAASEPGGDERAPSGTLRPPSTHLISTPRSRELQIAHPSLPSRAFLGQGSLDPEDELEEQEEAGFPRDSDYGISDRQLEVFRKILSTAEDQDPAEEASATEGYVSPPDDWMESTDTPGATRMMGEPAGGENPHNPLRPVSYTADSMGERPGAAPDETPRAQH